MSIWQAWKRNSFSANSFAYQSVESFFGQYKAAHGEGAGEDTDVDIVAMCFHLNWLEINEGVTADFVSTLSIQSKATAHQTPPCT